MGLFDGYELKSLNCSVEFGFVICSSDMRWPVPRASEGLYWVASSLLVLCVPVLRDDLSSRVLKELNSA